MAVSDEFKAYILDQLSDFGEIEAKKMFGGIGLFMEGKMFGMIAGATFRLKVDEENKPDFIALGMEPYHNPGKKKGMPYWEVPAEVTEDKSLLKEWAQKAYDAALRGIK